jgi:hypothetical protein
MQCFLQFKSVSVCPDFRITDSEVTSPTAGCRTGLCQLTWDSRACLQLSSHCEAGLRKGVHVYSSAHRSLWGTSLTPWAPGQRDLGSDSAKQALKTSLGTERGERAKELYLRVKSK